MKKHSLLYSFFLFAWVLGGEQPGLATPPPESKRISGHPPVLGCWFWHDEEFAPDGFRPFLDLIAQKSHYDILTTSLRVKDRELTDPGTIEQASRAVEYAQKLGIGIALDLDVRLARTQFRKQYPDEMQWMVRLRDCVLDDRGKGEVRIESALLSDHYTHRATPYIPLSGRIEGVFLFSRGSDGIIDGPIRELDHEYETLQVDEKGVGIRVDMGPAEAGRSLCLRVGFEHFAPDVFAPHLLDYQQRLLEIYKELPLVGACKDEWGFPPDFQGCPDKNDYWFSSALARTYREATGGRDLERDFLLMTYGERGQERERIEAINTILRISFLRNGEIENHFYEKVKQIFGRDALVATHPTWYPFPGVQEFMKNGLDWWIAKRDFAQTDESTPYSVRTSLAKKWGSPVWINMFYAEDPAAYPDMMWRDAMAGGRINYHPPWPTTKTGSLLTGHEAILNPDWKRGDERIRLLDFISSAPLDCPVAILFGHTAAMNWTRPGYGDTGVGLADRFWQAGYPADLIPTSEIGNNSLKVTEEGRLQYGDQVYSAAILYHPEFETNEAIDFLKSLDPLAGGVFLLGDRTRDFRGNDTSLLSESWPQDLVASSSDEVFAKGMNHLKHRQIPVQSPATGMLGGFGYRSSAPAKSGFARLVDGTHLFLHGEGNPAGDTIASVFEVDGSRFFADFEGVLAIRFDEKGQISAFAAGGLKELRSGSLVLNLDTRLDMAVKTDENGESMGIYRSAAGEPPPPLKGWSVNWTWIPISSE